MKKIFITALALLIALSGFSQSKTEPYTLETLLDTGFVKTKISSLGGHQEDCIEIRLTNISDNHFYLKLEPGRRLVSLDTSIQDIFIVKERIIACAPDEEIEFSGYGFCCQSSHSSPYKEAVFSSGYMEDEKWIKIAEVINAHDFPPFVIQSAVWILSDNHSFSSLHADDMESILPLRLALAEELEVEMPWYTLTYVQDTTVLFTDRPKTVTGSFDFVLRNNSFVSVNVRKSSGELMTTLLRSTPKNPGTYTQRIQLNVRDWPKGRYEVQVIEDNSNIIDRRKFEL
jgi:hypothetical protein